MAIKVGTMPDLLLTTVVGSYPQPDWLIDRAALGSRLPPRVRAREIWRVAPEQLEQAQDDATIVAIRDMERAGIDIITDGEIRRESYSNRFATALEGMDLDNPSTALDRTGHPNPVPRVVGPIRRTRPVRSEEHTSELQSQSNLVCRLLLEKKKKNKDTHNDVKTLNLFKTKYEVH